MDWGGFSSRPRRRVETMSSPDIDYTKTRAAASRRTRNGGGSPPSRGSPSAPRRAIDALVPRRARRRPTRRRFPYPKNPPKFDHSKTAGGYRSRRRRRTRRRFDASGPSRARAERRSLVRERRASDDRSSTKVKRSDERRERLARRRPEAHRHVPRVPEPPKVHRAARDRREGARRRVQEGEGAALGALRRGAGQDLLGQVRHDGPAAAVDVARGRKIDAGAC